MEEYIIDLWNTYVSSYGYIILFCWSILEGELGLIFAGLAAHTGHINIFIAIFVAGLGAFSGDQVYFYIGRFNKPYIQKKLHSQRRKLALAHLLLQKYGWLIIFAQRYMYGMRTIIPISIGITKYSGVKFAIINLLSAWLWAAITIVATYFLGDFILEILQWFKGHLYLLVIFIVLFLVFVIWYFNSQTKKVDRKIADIETELASKTKGE